MNQSTLTIASDKELKRKTKILASFQGKSMSTYLRTLIEAEWEKMKIGLPTVEK